MVSGVTSRGYVRNPVARDSPPTYVADLRGMKQRVHPAVHDALAVLAGKFGLASAPFDDGPGCGLPCRARRLLLVTGETGAGDDVRRGWSSCFTMNGSLPHAAHYLWDLIIPSLTAEAMHAVYV